MVRYMIGGASALLLIAAIFFIWRGRAEAGDPIPPAPEGRLAIAAPAARPLAAPPAMTERDREQKRFARADGNGDGRILLVEQLLPRRKAFARVDRDSSGSLSFEEWSAGTAAKFAKADKDRSGWLSAAEYEAMKPKPKPRPKCRC
jgi:hypothetical protein